MKEDTLIARRNNKLLASSTGWILGDGLKLYIGLTVQISHSVSDFRLIMTYYRPQPLTLKG